MKIYFSIYAQIIQIFHWTTICFNGNKKSTFFLQQLFVCFKDC